MAAKTPPRTLLLLAAGAGGLAVLVAIFLVMGGGSSRSQQALTRRVATVASTSAFVEDSYEVPSIVIVIDTDGSMHVGKAPRRWKTLNDAPRGAGEATTLTDLKATMRKVKEGKRKHSRYDDDLASLGDASDYEAPRVVQAEPDSIALVHPPDTNDDGSASGRQGTAHGKYVDSLPYDLDALVAAAAGAKATALVDVLAKVDGAIAVVHDGKLHALRATFQHQSPEPAEPGAQLAPWAEVRFAGGGLDVEGVPDQPIHVALPLRDSNDLISAYNQARTHRGIDERHDVDVLVAPDTTVQQLVDVVAALGEAGAEEINLGRVPAAGSPAAERRGKRIPMVSARSINVSYDVDASALESAMNAQRSPILDCYKAALAQRPDLAGDVSVDLAVASDDTVTAQADGLTPEMSQCISTALGVIKVHGNGYETVHASYALTFRN